MEKIIMKLIVFFFFCLTSNIFSQYTELNSGVTVNLTSVSINQPSTYFTNNNIWVCGNNGTVIKTTNQGATWVNISGNGIPSNVNLVNIWCIDTNTTLTAGNIGTTTYLYRTSNKGASWITIFTQTNGNINAVYMNSSTQGFMEGNPVGGRWSLWKTLNGGVSWDSTGLMLNQAGSETGFNNALSIVGNRIWFGTNNTRIYYSTNFGTNWQILSTAPEVNSSAVWFYYQDSTCGYFGGSNYSYKTTNYGLNWTQLSCPGNNSFSGFVWGMPGVYQDYPPMISFAVRNDSTIYTNMTMGNWNSIYHAPAGVYRFIANVYNISGGGISYGVRSNGGITKFVIEGGEVKKISSVIPGGYSLLQNYPNPFNPTTKIRYQITKNDLVQLKIYDILGHDIVSLVNEQETPGTYEVEFDASKYPSGVYFYKLSVTSGTGEFTETKKLVLLK